MRKVALIALLLTMAGVARASDIKPAFVFDLPAMQDRAFIEGLVAGVGRFAHDTKIDFVEMPVSKAALFEDGLRRLAERGRDPILGVGVAQAEAIAKVAKDFPNTRWIVIDGIVDLPNVRSVVFDEWEGSFLVGVAAAMASKSGKVGFVGRDDIPRVGRFVCGYAQGAKYADKKVEIVEELTGAGTDTPSPATMAARRQFDRGVDVIYAVAGLANLGVYQTAADHEKLAVGLGSFQYYLAPGTMFTAMIERIDMVAYDSLMAANNGTWQPGIVVLGLKEGVVDWAIDPDNGKLVTPEMKAKVEAAKAEIIAGKIKLAAGKAGIKCNS